ncbi:tRNA (guanine(9)-N1)-methyltransferase-like [Rutidosis leptorrhynchoides]|uniref:tRNA (guanine(9)-N1)-methyltransferase-like n=1 Tax=Rutidosis leptorrhynchoides TaxID=125765 RepID=UPI003A9977F9
MDAITADVVNDDNHQLPPQQTLSKNAQKKLLKQQRFEAKKAEKKAAAKEEKKLKGEMKRKEWEEKLSVLSEDEKLKLIESRKEMRKERMDQRNEERQSKSVRLSEAKKHGQNIVIDLQFSYLMAPNEIHSLVKQITYCYAVNGKSVVPSHLWLTGYEGEMGNQLEKIPGFDKWIIDKDSAPYIDTFETQKEQLVYLTADSENMLTELDPKKIYIIGGLVDRNRWKGITMNKAVEQGIQTAKLPIGNYLKMSSSQVLTVNQVIEILLKFLETKDWKASFFHVVPQRKRCECEAEALGSPDETEGDEKLDQEIKRQCVET